MKIKFSYVHILPYLSIFMMIMLEVYTKQKQVNEMVSVSLSWYYLVYFLFGLCIMLWSLACFNHKLSNKQVLINFLFFIIFILFLKDGLYNVIPLAAEYIYVYAYTIIIWLAVYSFLIVRNLYLDYF